MGRTVAMPVALIPPTERPNNQAGASFTPIAQSPAYPAYSHMHITVEVASESRAQRLSRGCLACLRNACTAALHALARAMWAVARWTLGAMASTAARVALLLVFLGAFYYEYLLNRGEINGPHDPRLKQDLYGAFVDLFRSARKWVGA